MRSIISYENNQIITSSIVYPFILFDRQIVEINNVVRYKISLNRARLPTDKEQIVLTLAGMSYERAQKKWL